MSKARCVTGFDVGFLISAKTDFKGLKANRLEGLKPFVLSAF